MYTVLIMDKDHDLLVVLERFFSSQGYHVVCSPPTHDIIHLVEKFHPDVIIMEYLMNEINGGELCLVLKENALTNHIPVVLLSSSDRLFKSLGRYSCNLFLPKTADISQLITEINSLLGEKREGSLL